MTELSFSFAMIGKSTTNNLANSDRDANEANFYL